MSGVKCALNGDDYALNEIKCVVNGVVGLINVDKYESMR